MIRVYNTLSKSKEPFEPVRPGKVGIYLCGPTVYKPSHIGHMVGPVIFDTVKRYLVYCGYEVTLVINVTDVDDKLINESTARGIPMAQLAAEMTADYMDNLLHGLTRAADLVLLVVDLGSDDGVEHCQDVLDRLSTTKTRLAARSYLDEEDVGLSYTRTFLVPNKIDLPEAQARLDLLHELCPVDFTEYQISAQQGTGMEALREAIYETMDVVRVYTKLPSAKQPDMDRPFTVRRGSSLWDLAGQVHKDYVEGLKFARVWGTAVHDATTVKGDYVLHDKDIVELHL